MSYLESLTSGSAGHPPSSGRARISVTVSIGVAVLGQHGSDLFELLAAADLALYRAKDAGRNQVRLYAPRQRSAPDTVPDKAGHCAG